MTGPESAGRVPAGQWLAAAEVAHVNLVTEALIGLRLVTQRQHAARRCATDRCDPVERAATVEDRQRARRDNEFPHV